MRAPRVSPGPLLLLAALGALLGLLGARYVLVGSGLSLLPWSVAALAAGWWSRSRPRAAAAGVVFGFALAAVFMVTGYSGAEPLVTRLPAVTLLGLVGAAGAGLLAVLGATLRRLATRDPATRRRPE
jgi:hypothetical protein